MSNESFDRIATLKVFQRTTLANPIDGSLSLVDVDPIGTAFSSKQDDGSPGFRIKFKIDKVIEVTPNPTSIFIYNLGPDSRALFEKENNLIILEAGYQNQAEVIFKGTVSRCRTRKEGADYVTQIEAADGLFAVQNSRIDQSFKSGVTASSLINTLVGAMKGSGLSQGDISGVPSDGYNQGVVLSGRTIDKLKEVLDKHDLTYSIENGSIHILPLGSSRGTPAFAVSPSTGLVGIPEKRDVGISFKMLMQPKLGVFQKVLISSKFVNGVYTTAKINHDGDTWEGPWYTEVEAS